LAWCENGVEVKVGIDRVRDEVGDSIGIRAQDRDHDGVRLGVGVKDKAVGVKDEIRVNDGLRGQLRLG